jgi:hypothetical protein
MLWAVFCILALANISAAWASTTTYTDSSLYFATAGPQNYQDFNSPLSTSPTSVTYAGLIYVRLGYLHC